MSKNKMTTLFLKECLADSLLQLMREKEFSQITINEIAANAQVNRSTWFRHFSDKKDALTFKLILLWERWIKVHPYQEPDKFLTENADIFFQFIYEYREILSLLYQARLRTCIYDVFVRTVAPKQYASLEECYFVQFVSHGIFGLLEEWMRRNFQEPPHKMARLYMNIIKTAGKYLR